MDYLLDLLRILPLLSQGKVYKRIIEVPPILFIEIVTTIFARVLSLL